MGPDDALVLARAASNQLRTLLTSSTPDHRSVCDAAAVLVDSFDTLDQAMSTSLEMPGPWRIRP